MSYVDTNAYSPSTFRLSDWLSGIELEQYEELFKKNKVYDFDTLKRLTDLDLQEMGIFNIGDRKRILSSIEHKRFSFFRARNIILFFSFLLITSMFLPLAKNIENGCMNGNFALYDVYSDHSCFYYSEGRKADKVAINQIDLSLRKLRTLLLSFLFIGILGIYGSITNVYGLEKRQVKNIELYVMITYLAVIIGSWRRIFWYVYKTSNEEYFYIEIIGNDIFEPTHTLIVLSLIGITIGVIVPLTQLVYTIFIYGKEMIIAFIKSTRKLFN